MKIFFKIFIELISFSKETPCGRVQAGAAALQERENKNKIIFFFCKKWNKNESISFWWALVSHERVNVSEGLACASRNKDEKIEKKEINELNWKRIEIETDVCKEKSQRTKKYP